MITLITMGAGNVKVLGETLKSLSKICDEIIYGDMLLFEEDRAMLKKYESEYDFKFYDFPFNYIFKNGFAAILNSLSALATNDLTLYMNTSEVIEVDNGTIRAVYENEDCNTFYFDHATDPHRWYRLGDRRELQWSGRIHECLDGEMRPFHKPVFRMKDLEKDLDNSFKAKVFNDAKEICYFKNYMALIDSPEEIGATDPGWIRFAKENYDSMKERLEKKGRRCQAYIDGDLEAYLRDCYDNPEFKKERFESNIGIEYQGDKKFLL